MKKVRVPLSTAGIEQLEKELQEYRKWQEEKMKLLAKKLADLGVDVATMRFKLTAADKDKDERTVVPIETANGFIVRATGRTVLFIEFGAGVTYGYGHPEANEYGMGPGTYPSDKGHWDDPNGWWVPKSAGGYHTYGNPPAMPMYEARKTIIRELPRIVKEVFSG